MWNHPHALRYPVTVSSEFTISLAHAFLPKCWNKMCSEGLKAGGARTAGKARLQAKQRARVELLLTHFRDGIILLLRQFTHIPVIWDP